MAIRFDVFLACSVCGGHLETESDGEMKGPDNAVGMFKVLPCVSCDEVNRKRQIILEELAAMAQLKSENS